MKYVIIFGLLLAASMHAEARNAQGPGTHGQPGIGHSSAASTGGQGGKYTLGDEFQPWPQAEMQQYAKPTFEAYKGE